MGQLGQADGVIFEPFGKIMRGSLPIQRGIHRQHNLVDAANRHSRYQAVDIEIFGPNAVQGRQPPTEHMIFTRKQPRPVERPQVRHILDHADRADVTARIDANAARISGVDIAAGIAYDQPLLDIIERAQQRLQHGLALLHQMQHHAPRRTRAKPGQFRQCLCECVYFLRCHVCTFRALSE